MIHYRKISDGNGAAWLSTATLRELIWSDRYEVKPVDAGTLHEFPFTLAVGETVTLLVWDKPGKLQDSRTVVQTLTRVERSTGNENSYTRSSNGGVHSWSEWERYPDVNELNEMSCGLGTAVEWGAGMRIDTFVNPGTYNITGERTSIDDGLPIANAAPGHTVHARLVVLDSSIKGTGESDDMCITQVLTLSNRTGGDGDVYVRTGRASSKNQLIGGYGWEQWAKLQQNIQAGQVTSLDSYIENGMYSGLYTNGNGQIETFVMVVINNYAVAGANGKVRSVSQFKYALALDGTFSYRSRSGQGNTGISWGEWIDLNGATTAMIQDNSITEQKLGADLLAKIGKNSDDAAKSANGAYWTSSPDAVTLNINKNDGTVGRQTLPAATTEKAGVMSAEDKNALDTAASRALRTLFVAAGAEYNDTATDIEKTAPWGEAVTHKAGHYYLNGLGDITEEQMIDIYNARCLPYPYADEYYRNIEIRTNIGRAITGGDTSFYHLGLLFFYVNALEVAVINANLSMYSYVFDMRSAFKGCKNLSYIIGTIYNVSSAVQNMINECFKGCEKLKSVKIRALHLNISFSDSSLISKESIFFLIKNANTSSAVAITLHPDAYARLANDADIVTALEEQPLVSLVSA